MINLDKLLYLRGISAEYFDYSGNLCQVAWQDRLRLLEALGHDVEDQQAIDQAVYELDAKPWTCWLKKLYIIHQGDFTIDIHSEPQALQGALAWQISTEKGESFEGSFVPEALAEVGEYYIEATRYTAHRLDLPELPPGYHQIDIYNQDKRETAQIIVAPRQCFNSIQTEQPRIWGLSCQLYTLRSERNWGIGDFSDLNSLITLSASQGADVIGLNPLHVPYLDGPDYASPYSPSDRRFINPVYIDVEIVEEYSSSPAIIKFVQKERFQAELSLLRQENWVNYDGVNRLKYGVLGMLYQQFVLQHVKAKTQRAEAFKAFVDEQGDTLQQFSQFESKNNHFANLFTSDPLFFQYLQWIASEQLGACQRNAKEQGMKVGLMGDLAVGSIVDGFETQQNPSLFNTRVSIGAPPDPLASDGQNWNLPVLDPVAIREQNYAFFIELLRSNMSACGALRIDHVMGLMRLWWCLPGNDQQSASGAYVYYSFEHLMAILRLESQRNQCMVIGEDMGVVPDEVRRAMHESLVYSNNVLYFEQHYDCRFKHPDEHQVDAVLFVTNHDVSTLAGWWSGNDIRKREEIGLINSETAGHQLNHRRFEKEQLLSWLAQQNLSSEQWSQPEPDQSFDFELCRLIHQACARSQSKIMLLQLEDLQLIEDPVNIPGTYREYANWRRKQQQNCDQLFENVQVQSLLNLLNQERTT